MKIHKIEPVKRLLSKATGIGVPTREQAVVQLRYVRPRKLRFRADGYIPNNPKLALLCYRRVLGFDRKYDPAATLEVLFNMNGWGQAWRNGVYDFVHYHSMIHEVLGVARGSACLRLGGNKGKTLQVKRGDVLVIPAGVGHECLRADKNFLVVGAYPPQGKYNECRGSSQEYQRALTSIRRVALPKRNPVFGANAKTW